MQKAVIPEPNFIENRIEWCVSLLMQLHGSLYCFLYWRATGVTGTAAFFGERV